MTINLNFLRIPLHGLPYVNNIDDYNGLDKEQLASFYEDYDAQEIKGIIESIEWAIENPDYDFLSFAKPLEINFNNNEIYQYLCKLNESLKQL